MRKFPQCAMLIVVKAGGRFGIISFKNIDRYAEICCDDKAGKMEMRKFASLH